MMRKPFAICMLAAALPLAAFAHGGGLNAEGCHTNRKTGEYHCHRASAPDPARTSPRPAKPPASTSLLGARTVTGAYRNCTEARAAGAAPVRRGEPGYGPHLDRDNDGIGCE
tara:strand:+ start:311 stop:646 length:336 start_codon:yes stop_codon:yes gene_type:complete